MQKGFYINRHLIFQPRNQFIVSAIKFGKILSKFLIPMTLLYMYEVLAVIHFFSSIIVSHLTAHTGKANKY